LKCYFHPKKDAVGICSVCFKAICKSCVGDDANELVCKKCMRQGLQMLKDERQKDRPEPVREQHFSRNSSHQSNYQSNQQSSHQSKIQSSQKRSSGPGFLHNIFKEKKNLIENNIIDAEVITPVLFIGVIAGILCGIPILSLLFFIIIPIAGIVSILYLRAEQDYRVYIGTKKGIFTGVLMGIVAAIVSLIVTISLEAFLGVPIYNLITNMFGFLNTNTLNIVIALSGADAALSLNGIITRLLITLISFPILGGLFSFLGAKFLR